MSSGSRNEELESLLEAKYELEFCEDGEKEACFKAFEQRISGILEMHPGISRSELIEAIGSRYREFKSARIRAQRRRETL